MDSSYDYDLDPVSFITVGTQGLPGQRSFFLQAAQGSQVVTLLIEKEQAAALAAGLERLLDSVERDQPGQVSGSEPVSGNLSLLEPVESSFRVGSLGIGIDEENLRVLVIARAAGPEEEPAPTARFVATVEQILALTRHIPGVVSQGRPECPACGEPMDPEGHACPRRNGHGRVEEE